MKTLLSTSAVLAALLALASPVQAAEVNLNTTTTLTDENPPSDTAPETPQFTAVIDDLPLMQGLAVVPDDDVLFAEPHVGRIAQTTAAGAVDIDDVYKFYHRTLPQMGWKVVDGKNFMREYEMLRIDAHADGKNTTVRFSVTPK